MYRVFFLLLIHALLSAAQAQPFSRLATQQEVAREMPPGEQHFYELELAAGECARVELHSGKARLGLALLSEKKEVIASISDADSPTLKQMDIVAEQATRYLIRVVPELNLPAAVKYQLILKEKHVATANDRERFALHKLDWEVVSLYRQQEKAALQQAAAKGQTVAARWLALGEKERAAQMLNRAGVSLFLLSEHQAGREIFQQATTLFQQAGAKHGESVSIALQGLLELADGNYQKSFALATRALLMWNATKNEVGLRAARLLQAMHYRNIGEWKQAEALCRQLLPEAATGRIDEWDYVYREDVLMVMGIAIAGQGRVQEGVGVLEEALAIARTTHNRLNVVQMLAELGTIWRQANQPAKAIETFEQCLVVSRQLGIRSYESQALSELGNLYLLAGRRTEARTALTQAIAAGVYGGKNYLSSALHSLAQLQHAEGQFSDALASVEQSLQIIEGLRVQLPMQDTARVTTALLERKAYALRMDLLLHLYERNRASGYDAQALQASEFAHGRSLIQLLSDKEQAKLIAPDPALTKQLNDLRQQIAALTNEQLRLRINAASESSLKIVQRDLAAALAEMDRVTLEIRNNNPRSAALTLPQPLKLGEIQAQILDGDTILLEYSLSEERSFLFVATQKSLQVFNLPGRRIIEEAARPISEALARSKQPNTFKNTAEKNAWLQQNERAYTQSAAHLSNMLLAPAAGLLGQKRLMIVPDGALHHIPFAALPTPIEKSSAKNLKSGAQPLIVSHEILTLPSASTLALLRQEKTRQTQPPKILAMVADPVFQVNDERLVNKPLAKAEVLTDRVRAFAVTNEFGKLAIPRLPASRKEAEAIMALVPASESTVALDFDASYQTVTQRNLQDYRFVHFATHGLLDESQPELSGLLLAQINRQGENVQGYFTTLDAFQLKLNADLVVLSGCRTALGKEVNGEGLLGLSRAFMYAGAHRILASLWQVNDVATAELMRQFYQGMLGREKLSPTAALRAAQLAMLQSKQWKAPYYWAAFTIQGDW